MTETASGTVDREGRLIAATPRLAALQRAAGAALGEPFAVPALAALARLSHSLGVAISRTVIVAEADHDLDLVVDAKPAGDHVELVIGGWARRPPRRPWLISRLADPLPETPTVETEATWTVDARLIVTAWSRDPGAIGVPLTQLVRLIDNADGAMPLLGAVAQRSDFREQRGVLRDAPDVEVRLNGEVVRTPDDRFGGYRGTIVHVTAETTGEPPFDDAFVRQIDGALRGPLARIAANADQIASQVDGPLRRDYADYAGDIGTAARHLLAIVDDLTDLQAVERPDFKIEPDTIDLADLARRAAGLLQVRAADRDVRIDRPAADEALAARGDFRRVLQILVNLIGNAVRYSPTGSMIWLRTEHDADTAVLIVADQGKGIAPENHQRIFEKFERVDPSEADGSGLGLYIARRLARAMGGDISVDSAPGQGARFVLTLPAA